MTSRTGPLGATVVVPTWNGSDRIAVTLASLDEQTIDRDRFEVIVVDDGSTDDTEATISRFADQHPMLTLSCVRIEHAGVNAARNAGIRAAAGAIVVLFDDDEIVEADHLERVLAIMEDADHDWDGVGGPARATNSDAFRTCRRCSIGEATLPIEGQGTTPRLLGGNMAVRRSLFDEVGLFDPEISGRGDEVEWFVRANGEFLYDDSLFVWHRRDHLSLRRLLATGYRQGRSVPLTHQKVGDHEWRPSVRKLGRYVGHAVRAQCTNGLLQASREAGALTSFAILSLRRRRVARKGGEYG